MKRAISLAMLGFTLLAVPSLRAYGNKERKQIRVFVFSATDPSGFVDVSQKVLADSVKDLKGWFNKFTLVSACTDADVCIEVTGRGYALTGSLSATDNGLSTTITPNSIAALRVTFSAGDYKRTINGVSNTSPFAPNGYWASAADDAYAQIDAWIRDNYQKLISSRK